MGMAMTALFRHLACRRGGDCSSFRQTREATLCAAGAPFDSLLLMFDKMVLLCKLVKGTQLTRPSFSTSIFAGGRPSGAGTGA